MFSSFIWTVSGRFLRVALSLLATLFIARTAGPEGFGVYSAFLGIGIILAAFSAPAYQVVLPRLMYGEKWGHRDATGALILNVVITSFALSALALVVNEVMRISSLPAVVCFYFVFSEIFLTRLKGVLVCYVRLENMAQLIPAIDLMHMGPRVLFAFFLYLNKSSEVLKEWAWCLFLTDLFALAAYAVFFWTKNRFPHFSISKSFALYGTGLKLAMYNFIQNLNFNIGRVVLVKFAGEGAAGIYSMAQRILFNLVVMPMNSFVETSFPHFLEKLENEGLDKIKHQMRSRYKYFVLLSAVIAGVYFLLSPFLLRVVGGAQYRDAGLLLQWATPWVFLRLLNMFSTQYFILVNKERLTLNMGLASAVIGITTSVWAAQSYGALGVMAGAIVCEFVAFLGYSFNLYVALRSSTFFE